MEFSRQEYMSRLPLLSPGDLPDPGLNTNLLHLLHRRRLLYYWVTCNQPQIAIFCSSQRTGSLFVLGQHVHGFMRTRKDFQWLQGQWTGVTSTPSPHLKGLPCQPWSSKAHLSPGSELVPTWHLKLFRLFWGSTLRFCHFWLRPCSVCTCSCDTQLWVWDQIISTETGQEAFSPFLQEQRYFSKISPFFSLHPVSLEYRLFYGNWLRRL